MCDIKEKNPYLFGKFTKASILANTFEEYISRGQKEKERGRSTENLERIGLEGRANASGFPHLAFHKPPAP